MDMNYARYLTPVALARQQSPIRKTTAILAQSPPTMISLAAGMPNPATFPFLDCSIRTRDGKDIALSEQELRLGLQYSPTPGIPGLIDWVKDLQSEVHQAPDLDVHCRDVVITAGSQDGLCKALEMMISRGDSVLMDSPAYPGTLAILKPLGAKVLTVAADHDGMRPDSLEDILGRWTPDQAKDPKSNIPKVLIVIPNASNPAGSTITLERRKQIYALAQKYDLLIIEDDPYYYLQFSKPYLPSFLSMDVDGRVLRSDSFSKIISSGLRLGFLTGPRPLVERIALHMQASILHASGLSQVLVLSFLQRLRIQGFLEHVDRVADFYRSQKEAAMLAASEHLEGVAEWSEPKGGMFLWIKVKGVKDTKVMIEEKAIAKEVLMVPGCAFEVDDAAPSPFLRASFSMATPPEIGEAFRRLRLLIDEELGLDPSPTQTRVRNGSVS